MTRHAPVVPATLRNRLRPVTAAGQRTVPVAEVFSPLFPDGLPRGITLTSSGDTARSCAFALAATATRAGSWLAVLGLGDPGWQAAAELGMVTARVVSIDLGRAGGQSGERSPRRAGERIADCIAAALDGFDPVLVGPQVALGTATERRLGARARERGAVLIGVHEDPAGPIGAATGEHRRTIGPFATTADLRVTTRGGRWQGIDAGHGRLTGRQVEVVAEGKRLAGRRRSTRLWLPGPDGTIAPIGESMAGATPRSASSPHANRIERSA